MKTAIVIGATGLVGAHLTRQLLENPSYQKIKLFVRKSPNITHKKLVTHIVNFDDIQFWKKHLTGDDLFSAMGTTIKKAGSQANQYKIDFTYQYNVAKAAADNGVKQYLLVSSAGADSHSKNFYLRMKGDLENAVAKLNFKNIIVFKPSILTGKRSEHRIFESLGIGVTYVFTTILPFIKKYRPIKGATVAAAMINAANLDIKEKNSEYSLDQIFSLTNPENH
ncbi:MAG: NAD(P)H-binding protein [Candidatus Marinimicrobia bacterium]|nr:NAD(P)H-binding protein [Candidatus Neomarinimicrobiota bacterium]